MRRISAFVTVLAAGFFIGVAFSGYALKERFEARFAGSTRTDEAEMDRNFRKHATEMIEQYRTKLAAYERAERESDLRSEPSHH